ncbi:MAG: hypothetical protein M1812_004482 [Candelaria pacifica]|nr:MAG: hypothetical protein M1812_004482 [Candelaria pacifica]
MPSPQSNNQPHLLNLPPELRLQILYQAFLPTNNPPTNSDPAQIDIDISTTAKTSTKANPSAYYWGTSLSTSPLLINAQLHHEAEEILYSNFRFAFPHYLSTDLVHEFLSGRSPRVRGLIRDIKVIIIISSRLDVCDRDVIQQWKEAFEVLRNELTRLRSVVVGVNFVGTPVGSEKGRGELVDAVLELASVFKGVRDLRLDYWDRGEGFEERGEVVRCCKERILEEGWGIGR